ncbi:MAG: hypothetical protein H6825_05175 [Planctomycetes bacterium]|nr:hypothetical protein [Planctomycetota bacterium]
MVSKSDAEKWCSNVKVADIMADWSHIAGGHLPDKSGAAPAGKSVFTQAAAVAAKTVYDTCGSATKRLLYQAGDSSRCLVVRDFAPTIVGKDGAKDCTQCVVVLGLASSGAKKGQPIVFTAYPASDSYVNGLSPLS